MVHEWFMSGKIKHLQCCQGHRPQVSCVFAGWSCKLKVSGATLACFTLKKKKVIICFSDFFFLPAFSHYCSSLLLSVFTPLFNLHISLRFPSLPKREESFGKAQLLLGSLASPSLPEGPTVFFADLSSPPLALLHRSGCDGPSSLLSHLLQPGPLLLSYLDPAAAFMFTLASLCHLLPVLSPLWGLLCFASLI